MAKIKKFDSINVVPFIDIMLVLLVIILTTASFVSQGIIPVDLPSSSSSDRLEPQKELIITINENSEIFFDKELVNKEDFEDRLLLVDKKTDILINCDKNISFEKFVFILDLAKKHSFETLGIITNDTK
ncbi:MAG: biopolymer transporter ExbD [Arcobacteraceae bacterium]|jgi:biopolymer transport protein ExbD|nr:biopolymer transporter ExbD [Arcobacteraceae bacterium]MDY0364419.1 biopolymer transporter ExbD [Arcobacteraceae bacterium]